MSKRQGNILGHGAFSIARGEFESKCICSPSIDFCQAVAVPLSEELFSGMYYIIPHWHCVREHQDGCKNTVSSYSSLTWLLCVMTLDPWSPVGGPILEGSGGRLSEGSYWS